MHLPESQSKAAKARGQTGGIPYQRFVRVAIEEALAERSISTISEKMAALGGDKPQNSDTDSDQHARRAYRLREAAHRHARGCATDSSLGAASRPPAPEYVAQPRTNPPSQHQRSTWRSRVRIPRANHQRSTWRSRVRIPEPAPEEYVAQPRTNSPEHRTKDPYDWRRRAQEQTTTATGHRQAAL